MNITPFRLRLKTSNHERQALKATGAHIAGEAVWFGALLTEM